MMLRLVGSDIVRLDEGTDMWVDLGHFAIETADDGDRALLASLIASAGYAHDYASPFDADAVITEPAVHGRWWRSRANRPAMHHPSPDSGRIAPADIEREPVDGLAVGQPLQTLQHQHRRDHRRRHRTTPDLREQVDEKAVREQPVPVLVAGRPR